ncbi:GreA/GreB family elongation factor [uncultured Desulfosarcina sp.]|uniref:GreA/GreB family elongation factor n=1 Tax=uncultured Desulfosarcina sp. TaxID=218289 RepID=UPI0029C8B27C|nr:GreA/GreB family elongation factor [uncultured Desulfosarcina sp.]
MEENGRGRTWTISNRQEENSFRTPLAPEQEIIAEPKPIFEVSDEPHHESLEPVTVPPDGNGHQGEFYVQINDTVTYAFIDDPDERKMVQIVRGKGSVSEGIISHTSPIAQTLLGAFLNEQVTAYLPTGAKELKIFDIVKS